MASALTILIILAAAGSLIAWLDWISRNIDDALDEAVGKSAAGKAEGGGSDAGPTADAEHTLTRPYRTSGQRTFNR